MYLSNWTRQYCTPGNEATCEISHHQLRADKGFQTFPGLRTGLEGWLAAYQPFFLAGNINRVSFMKDDGGATVVSVSFSRAGTGEGADPPPVAIHPPGGWRGLN